MNDFRKLSKLFLGVFGRTPVAVLSVAAAVSTLATSAQAAVVTSAAANIVVPDTTLGAFVNVVTGVSSTTSGSAVPGWDLRFWGNSLSPSPLMTINNSSSAPTNAGSYVMYGDGTGNLYVSDLAVGSVVGASSSFFSGPVSTTAAGSPWALNSTDYFGFRFLNEADGRVYYGYGTMIVGASLMDRTIGNIYYESVSGAPITVQAAAVSAVPEPASWGLMLGGLALAGTVARRRKKRSDAAQ